MSVLSNPRHELVAQELARGSTASDAYVAAGYRASRSAASRLSTNVNIVTRVAELQQGAAEKAELDVAWVLDGLRENFERAMQHVEIKDSSGKGTGEYKYDGPVANRSLELVGKHLGMFVEKHEHTGADGGPIQTEEVSARDVIHGRISGIAARIGTNGGSPKPH